MSKRAVLKNRKLKKNKPTNQTNKQTKPKTKQSLTLEQKDRLEEVTSFTCLASTVDKQVQTDVDVKVRVTK